MIRKFQYGGEAASTYVLKPFISVRVPRKITKPLLTEFRADNRSSWERKQKLLQAELARKDYDKLQLDLKAQEGFDRLIHIITPSTYVENIIGLDLGPIGRFVVDIATPGAIGGARKLLTATGKGVFKNMRTRVVANEMNKTFNKGIRTTPAKTNWTSYEDFRLNGLTGLLMLERNWLDRELETGNPNNMVHYDFGDHKSSFRKNNGAYVLNNQLVPGLSSKEQTNYVWWGSEGPWQHSLWMFVNPKLLTPTRYISTPKTKQFLRVNDHPEKVIGLNLVAPLTIMDNEFVTEGPVDLSNASIILKDPLGWWGRVKYTTSSPQQATYPWQLFNSRYSRFQLPNGKIRLLLPSHTEATPRQFVLEPQSNNKYYVHMRTWDGDKVPANMSSAEKNTLFEALYNELPNGAEILFPQSGPGNYATRGTVAGLLHLSRDSRFTPGTKGTLYYLDKDGKTVKTYEGTSFIKSSENLYSKEPVIRGKNYEDYVTGLGDNFLNNGANVKLVEPNPELTKITDRIGFTPIFLMWPGKGLRALAKEITRRLEQQGMDVDKQTVNLPGVGEGTVREVIDKNVGLPSYIGYFKKPGVSGSYNKKTGITLVDPTEHNKTVTTMQHERNMHGTERILTDKMWEPYLNFLNNIFNGRSFNTTIINNKKHYSVTDPDNAMLEFPITSSALKKEELRATLGQYRKDLYDLVAYPKAKAAGLDIKPDDLEGLRPFFELAVDELTIPLVKLDLHSINAYGRTYAKLGPKWNPNFLEELKQLLKYSPGVLPFMYNEEK